MPRRRLLKGANWRDYDLVFAGRLGQPLDAHNLAARHFKRLEEMLYRTPA